MIGLRDECTTDPLPELDFNGLSPNVRNVLLRDRGRLVPDTVFQSTGEGGTASIVPATNIRITTGMERTPESLRRTAKLNSQVFGLNTEAFAAILRSLQASLEGHSHPLSEQVIFPQRPEEQSKKWRQVFAKLRSYSSLVDGWDGYCAPPPLPTALKKVHGFLYALRHSHLRPTRLNPSVVGGIGVTFRKCQRKSYVEFYNDGTIHALFSDGESEPRTCQVLPTPAGYRPLIMEIQEYLNG
jgi:hypothetical protein